MRVWKAPSRWPGGDAGAGVRAGVGAGGTSGGGRPLAGLEFCATLLTNSSICSFSCVLLRPSGCAPGGGDGVGEGSGRVPDEAHQEKGKMCYGTGEGRKRPRSRAGPDGGSMMSRLYCVIGSDNGFLQAWELSLDGEDGVGGQPLWSQKVRCDRHVVNTRVFCRLRICVTADTRVPFATPPVPPGCRGQSALRSIT